MLGIFSPFEWKIYPSEFIASEKIHCLLDRGDLNTRGKDIYDLSQVLNKIPISKLSSAIKRTFKNRKFELSQFFNTANKINTDLLEENYKKAMVATGDITFEECWKIVLNKMVELDQYNNS